MMNAIKITIQICANALKYRFNDEYFCTLPKASENFEIIMCEVIDDVMKHLEGNSEFNLEQFDQIEKKVEIITMEKLSRSQKELVQKILTQGIEVKYFSENLIIKLTKMDISFTTIGNQWLTKWRVDFENSLDGKILTLIFEEQKWGYILTSDNFTILREEYFEDFSEKEESYLERLPLENIDGIVFTGEDRNFSFEDKLKIKLKDKYQLNSEKIKEIKVDGSGYFLLKCSELSGNDIGKLLRSVFMIGQNKRFGMSMNANI